ncbi:MAG TPA: adenylyltransferase/cytidyltransferase family protein [Bryobacteraceae bacterium]|nr:adenylyltransferase/cytidyltransferase family protein [Bryobacteraceae bacterium]
MEFFRRASGRPQALGLFPGTFNPVTLAHLALARAALACVEEVVFILPRAFPHKRYEGASFEQRVHMLEAALANEPRFSIAATEGGLFIEIARECRTAYGPAPELYFLCGRDAAERIVNWNYGAAGAFAEQLREYHLLVAPRQGVYKPPSDCLARIHSLALEQDYDELSASEVRVRIARGERWEHLVPAAAVDLVREIYGGA